MNTSEEKLSKAFGVIFDQTDKKMVQLHQEHFDSNVSADSEQNPFKSMAVMFDEHKGIRGLALAGNPYANPYAGGGGSTSSSSSSGGGSSSSVSVSSSRKPGSHASIKCSTFTSWGGGRPDCVAD